MRNIIIAIDGYSACGKSTTAKKVASILGYKYVDSGAMYRAVTLYFLEYAIPLNDFEQITKALQNIRLLFRVNEQKVSELFLNERNVEKEIRTMKVSGQVSQVSSIKQVRDTMVKLQRKMGEKGGIVMDGRDIGSVVFPDAELKLFVYAQMSVRALRRQQELFNGGEQIELEDIRKNLEKRDLIDSTREYSPLVKPTDAIEMDTTYLTIDEQVDEVVRLALSSIIMR